MKTKEQMLEDREVERLSSELGRLSEFEEQKHGAHERNRSHSSTALFTS